MHDGSLATLEDVVEHYDKGGNANPSLDTDLKKKLGLTAQEKKDVVAFMKALSGETKKLDELLPKLPPGPDGRAPDPRATLRRPRRWRWRSPFIPSNGGDARRSRAPTAAYSIRTIERHHGPALPATRERRAFSCATGRRFVCSGAVSRVTRQGFGLPLDLSRVLTCPVDGSRQRSSGHASSDSFHFLGIGRSAATTEHDTVNRGAIMRLACIFILIFACFSALFLGCYAPALFLDRQFGYRDAGHYYYPLNQRVQKEWNQGRWPLWEPEENAGMPLLGNPTAAVFYPGKLVFAVLPYAWACRVYIVAHSALAFVAMLVLMRSWGTTWYGSALAALCLRVWRTDPVPVLQHHLSDRCGLAAAGNSRGRSLGPAGTAMGAARAGDRTGNASAGGRPAGRLSAGPGWESAMRRAWRGRERDRRS